MNGQTGSRGEQGGQGDMGKTGADGKDSPPTKYTFTDIIDPCGRQGAFDEVLFKTASGQVIAFFAASGGFLTLLPNGNYVTTDSTHCVFTVLNGDILNEHN